MFSQRELATIERALIITAATKRRRAKRKGRNPSLASADVMEIVALDDLAKKVRGLAEQMAAT